MVSEEEAIVNPHNDDEECFKWSVIGAEKVGMKDPQRVSNLRKFTDNYDWSGLEFPVSIKVMTEEKYLRTVMKPNFKSVVLFGENLMGCEMGKIKVVMNKQVYLGQAILDLSKIVMYEFPMII